MSPRSVQGVMLGLVALPGLLAQPPGRCSWMLPRAIVGPDTEYSGELIENPSTPAPGSPVSDTLTTIVVGLSSTVPVYVPRRSVGGRIA